LLKSLVRATTEEKFKPMITMKAQKIQDGTAFQRLQNHITHSVK